MLSEKRWKMDAVLRLLLGVFVCYFSGSVVVGVMESMRSGRKPGPVFFLVSFAAVAFLMSMPLQARRPWTLENFTRRLVILMVSFWAGLMCGSWALKMAGPLPTILSASQLTVAILSFQGALLL